MNSGVVNLAESLSKDLKTGEEKKDLFLYDNEMRRHCGVIWVLTKQAEDRLQAMSMRRLLTSR